MTYQQRQIYLNPYTTDVDTLEDLFGHEWRQQWLDWAEEHRIHWESVEHGN